MPVEISVVAAAKVTTHTSSRSLKCERVTSQHAAAAAKRGAAECSKRGLRTQGVLRLGRPAGAACIGGTLVKVGLGGECAGLTRCDAAADCANHGSAQARHVVRTARRLRELQEHLLRHVGQDRVRKAVELVHRAKIGGRHHPVAEAGFAGEVLRPRRVLGPRELPERHVCVMPVAVECAIHALRTLPLLAKRDIGPPGL